MVHPFKPKAPASVPNNYVVSSKGDFTAMLDEIAGLALTEHRTDIACNGMPNIGMAFVQCDADFAEKIKQLPHVNMVESARHQVPMDKPAPSPRP
jgi:hypothetical protein